MRKFGQLGVVSAIAALLLILVTAGCGGGGSSPGAVLGRYFALSNQGKGDAAMELVARESRQWIGSSQIGESLFAGLGVKYKSTTILRTDIQGEVAIVDYHARYSVSAYDMRGTAELRREGSRWLITRLY